MNTKDTSGPAFPRPAFVGGGAATAGQVGMTLRDYFAAKAMQGFCSGSFWGEANSDECAVAAYEMADAMLKARDQDVGLSENDRRVAACLDALKHVSTEDLESGRMQSIGLRLSDAEKQCDELLNLLQQAERWISSEVDIGKVETNKPPAPVSEWDCEAHRICAEIRAAIAKSAGEPQ